MTSSSRSADGRTAARFVPQALPGSGRAFAPAHPEPFRRADGVAERSPAAAPSRESERERAYAEGLAAGRAELPWQEAESLRSAAASLEEAARALGALRRTYLVTHRIALVDLAVALAERVLAREVHVDRDALAGVVERALTLLGDVDPVRVHLCAGDLEAVRAGLAPALERLATENGLTLEADPNLRPGDVRVLAGASRVDARLGECLQRLREDLVEITDSDEAAS